MRMWFGYDDSGALRSMELRHMGWKPEVDFNSSSCPPEITALKAARAAQYGINHWIMHDCGCPPTASNCVCHNTVFQGFFVDQGHLAAKVPATIKLDGVAVRPGDTVVVGESFTLSIDADVPDGVTIKALRQQAQEVQEVELVVTDGKTPAHVFQGTPIGHSRVGCAGARIRSTSFVALRTP